MNATRLVVHDARVVAPTGPVRRADVVVDGGRITAVEPPGSAATGPATTVVDGRKQLVLPGWINAHTHSGQHLDRGVAPAWPLDLWLLWVVHGGIEITAADAHTLATAGAIEMLESGCTAVLDHVWVPPDDVRAHTEAIMAAYAAVGIRAVVAPMVQDLDLFDTLVLAPGTERPAPLGGPVDAGHLAGEIAAFVERWADRRHARLAPGVGPAAPQRCSDDLLLALAGVRRSSGAVFHTHVLETKDQIHATRQRFGHSVVEQLDRLGLLGPWASLAHGVWMDPVEYALVRERGATIVHNPVSNLRLGSGLLPLAGLLSGDVSVALGADGAASNDGQNMFEVAKVAALVHTLTGEYATWPSASAVWAASLVGGDRALRTKAEEPALGVVRPGAAADLVLVDAGRHPDGDDEALVRSLVFAESGHAVRTVIVDGEVVVADAQVVTIDRAEAMQRAREVQHRIHAAAPDRRAFFDRHGDVLDAAHRHAAQLPCGLERRASTTPAFPGAAPDTSPTGGSP